MSISLQLPKLMELKPRITVVGVGGAGGNAINNMIASGISGVDFIAANTDAQALVSSSAERRIQLGVTVTEGLGAGARPEIGEAAAKEAVEEIRSALAGSHMVFIAAGMGGGTGTGAASVFARTAKELGCLTVAIVTKPFNFEGARRQRTADAGIAELRGCVDTLIVIPNQNLFRIANERTTFAEAFLLADQVLHSGIACITDLIVREGLINLDFADVRTVMSGMGTAMMGTGEASGERRAIEAAEIAILNPLLDDVSLKGARGLLVSISGSRSMTLYEVDEAASRVRAEVDPEANIIIGATFDESLGEKIRVSIVASGIRDAALRDYEPAAQTPAPLPAATHVPAPQLAGAHHATQAAHAALHTAPAPHLPSAEPPRQRAEARMPEHRHSEPPAPVHTYEPHPYVADQAAMHGAPAPQNGLDAADAEASHGFAPAPEMSTFDAMAAEESESQDGAGIWQGPGDVVIELGLPQASQHGQTWTEAPAQRGRQPESLGGRTFTPQPPAAGPRTPRRSVEVDDFPEFAQRAYRAGARQGESRAAEPEPTVQKKSGGFLSRLTGWGDRTESNSAGDSSTSSARRDAARGEPSTRDASPESPADASRSRMGMPRHRPRQS